MSSRETLIVRTGVEMRCSILKLFILGDDEVLIENKNKFRGL
jgi:hypothetical protein